MKLALRSFIFLAYSCTIVYIFFVSTYHLPNLFTDTIILRQRIEILSGTSAFVLIPITSLACIFHSYIFSKNVMCNAIDILFWIFIFIRVVGLSWSVDFPIGLGSITILVSGYLFYKNTQYLYTHEKQYHRFWIMLFLASCLIFCFHYIYYSIPVLLDLDIPNAKYHDSIKKLKAS